MDRSFMFKYNKPPEKSKLNWKPKKGKGPDVGTYEVSKAEKYTQPKSKGPVWKVSEKKENVKPKKDVPGVGHYDVEKCFDKTTKQYKVKGPY